MIPSRVEGRTRKDRPDDRSRNYDTVPNDHPSDTGNVSDDRSRNYDTVPEDHPSDTGNVSDDRSRNYDTVPEDHPSDTGNVSDDRSRNDETVPEDHPNDIGYVSDDPSRNYETVTDDHPSDIGNVSDDPSRHYETVTEDHPNDIGNVSDDPSRHYDTVPDDPSIASENVSEHRPSVNENMLEDHPTNYANVSRYHPGDSAELTGGANTSACADEVEALKRLSEQQSVRERVARGLEMLHACTSGGTEHIYIVRSCLVDDLYEHYDDMEITDKKLSVTFEGETGVGLVSDLFACFWRDVSKTLFRGADCLVPYMPLHKLMRDSWKFKCLGTIFSHTVALTGTIPLFLARSVVIKLFTTFEVCDDCLLDDFLLYVTIREKRLLTRAMSDFRGLTAEEIASLQNFYLEHGSTKRPRASAMKKHLLAIAYQDLVMKPASYISQMRRGVPESHKVAFWRDLSIDDITELMQALWPTPETVAGVITTVTKDMTDDEERTLRFLKEFVASLDIHTLTDFLVFVTESVRQPRKISVTFGCTSVDNRPIGQPRLNHLVMITTFSSMDELKREFLAVLASPETVQDSEMSLCRLGSRTF